MTTLPEIDLQNALAEYAKANGANLIDNNCWILPTGQRTGYADLSGLQWTHETIAAPTEAELITIYDTWQAAHAATVTVNVQETTQSDNARNQLQSLMSGLHTLPVNDKGYAVYGRIFAASNGANQATIDSIVDRASAAAYITGLPEWQNMTAASRAFEAKVLEANARLCQVLLLVLG